MAPRPLIRYDAIRQQLETDPDVASSEEPYVLGRYFEADCLATDAVGDFVYFTGDKVAGYYQVSKADVEDPGTIPACGVIYDKRSVTRCLVLTTGVLPGTSIVPQHPYWVGNDGQISSSPPTRQAGKIVYAQVVGMGMSSTELLLRPQFMRHGLREP